MVTHEHFLKHHLQIAVMYAGPCLCASGNWILPCLKIALCNPAQPKVQRKRATVVILWGGFCIPLFSFSSTHVHQHCRNSEKCICTVSSTCGNHVSLALTLPQVEEKTLLTRSTAFRPKTSSK